MPLTVAEIGDCTLYMPDGIKWEVHRGRPLGFAYSDAQQQQVVLVCREGQAVWEEMMGFIY